MPRIELFNQRITQITVIEVEVGKQDEALAVMVGACAIHGASTRLCLHQLASQLGRTPHRQLCPIERPRFAAIGSPISGLSQTME